MADICPHPKAATLDPLWEGLRSDARDLLVREPVMSGLESCAATGAARAAIEPEIRRHIGIRICIG